MATTSRYPDINFVDTDLEAIETELINMYESIMRQAYKKRAYTVYPASPEYLFIKWIAQVIVQLKVIINDSAKSNVPRYAHGDFLDSLADLLMEEVRLPASAAEAMFRFYLIEPQEENISIPAGTRITPDGDLMFETLETITIKKGEISGDVRARCTTTGEAGNGFAPKQIKIIVDPYDYYDYAENMETTNGGADEETDSAFYERLRNRQKGYSTAGPMESYVFHAKSTSAAIADATASSPEAGVVDVRILLANNTTSPEAIMQEVQHKLSASTVRPLTDNVIVKTPEMVEFEVDIRYWITEPPIEVGLDSIKEEVKKAVEEYVAWQTEKIGRDINPSKLCQYIMDVGIKRMEIIKPSFRELQEIEAAKNINVSIKYEGIENE